jgi:uncharacterized protein (DUF2344 family)
MTFSPALSLGVASLSEILDVKLTVDVDAEELAAKLTKVSPEGLVFRGGVRLGNDDAGVSKILDGARYVVGVPRRALDAWGGESRLRAEIERVLASDDVRVIRRFERGLAKSVDVKRFLRKLAVDPSASAILDDARMAGDFVPVVAEVAITGEGGVKIAEIMEAVLGGQDVLPYHAVRAAMGTWHDDRLVSPIELELLRSLRAPKAVAEIAAGAAEE